MTIERAIIHETRYDYVEKIASSCHVAVLKPLCRATGGDLYLPRQTLKFFDLDIQPPTMHGTWRTDSFGNAVFEFEVLQQHQTLSVTASSTVDVTGPCGRGPSFGATPPWETIRDALRYEKNKPYVAESAFGFPSGRIPFNETLKSLALLDFRPQRPIAEAAYALMQRVHREFRYVTGSTQVNTPLEAVLAMRQGVCQDFAHVLIGAMRALGLASRYVSGYLLTDPAPGQLKLVGADASHAWASVWTGPAGGWLDLDPTNDACPDTRYVTLALGRDYADVPPLKGVIQGGGAHKLHVAVTVR
ncbi:MAG: transglutaminase domain-containing protein [Burkholderiaceae bacterium]|jgi:transglutaminase-like putative cysteine protease